MTTDELSFAKMAADLRLLLDDTDNHSALNTEYIGDCTNAAQYLVHNGVVTQTSQRFALSMRGARFVAFLDEEDHDFAAKVLGFCVGMM